MREHVWVFVCWSFFPNPQIFFYQLYSSITMFLPLGKKQHLQWLLDRPSFCTSPYFILVRCQVQCIAKPTNLVWPLIEVNQMLEIKRTGNHWNPVIERGKDKVVVSILSMRRGAKAMSGIVKTELNRWVSKVKCNSQNSWWANLNLGLLKTAVRGGGIIFSCATCSTQRNPQNDSVGHCWSLVLVVKCAHWFQSLCFHTGKLLMTGGRGWLAGSTERHYLWVPWASNKSISKILLLHLILL